MSNAETNSTHLSHGAPPLTNEPHATPLSIVDALNDVFGKQSQTRARAIHAIPTTPDTDGSASPREMALRRRL